MRTSRVIAFLLAASFFAVGCGENRAPTLDSTGPGPGTCVGGNCGASLEPCSNEGVRRACGEVQTKVGNNVTCMKGSQVCSAGFWGPCVGTPDSVKIQALGAGVLRPMALGSAQRCTNQCDPYCSEIIDTLDDAVGAGEGGAAIVDGGITIGQGINNAQLNDADLSTLADGGALPDGGIFFQHVLEPGGTAFDDAGIPPTTLRTADVYFMVDVTASMYDEAAALTNALTQVDATCTSANLDTCNAGIIQALKLALGPTATLGMGRFAEYDQFPYGFSGEVNVPYQHLLSIQGETAVAQQVAAYSRDESYPFFASTGSCTTNLDCDWAGGEVCVQNQCGTRGAWHGGGDLPEATVTALWQSMSGKGLYKSGPVATPIHWGTPRTHWDWPGYLNQPGAAPWSPFTPWVQPSGLEVLTGYAPDLHPSARLEVGTPCPNVVNPPADYKPGFPCFRANSMPIFVIVTDAPSHNGPNGWYSYAQLPAVGTDPAVGIPGAQAFPASVAMPTGGASGASFVDAIALPSGSQGPTTGIYYGSVPVRASGSGVGGGIRSIPASGAPVQVPQRNSLRDCSSTGVTVCNPTVNTVTQNIGVFTQPTAPQVHTRLSQQEPLNTATTTSLSNATPQLVPQSALSVAGALLTSPRYSNNTNPAQPQSAIGTNPLGSTATPYSALGNGQAIAVSTDALSATGPAVATGAYLSLNTATSAAFQADVSQLQFQRTIQAATTQSSLDNAAAFLSPTQVSQLDSLSAAQNAQSSTLNLTLASTYGSLSLPPVQPSSYTTTGTYKSGVTIAATTSGNVAPEGVSNALYNQTAFLSATAVDTYVSPAPFPTTVTALGSSNPLNSTTPYDTYVFSSATMYVTSSLLGTRRSVYSTTATDTYSASVPLLTTVSSLYGTYAAYNSQTATDSLSAATALILRQTALGARISALRSATTNDRYTSPSTPNVAVSALGSTSTPYNAVTYNLTPTAVNTGTQSDLTSPRAPDQANTVSCSFSSPNVSGFANASYTNGAVTFVPSWGNILNGTTIPGAAPTGQISVGSVSMAANQRIVVSVAIPTGRGSQPGQVTLYVTVDGTTRTAVVGSAQGSTASVALYQGASAGSATLAVSKDIGTPGLPAIYLTYVLGTPSCAGGSNFLTGGQTTAGQCWQCGSGYTWDSACGCSQTTTSTSCPNPYVGPITANGQTNMCWLRSCPSGWTDNVATNTCTAPRCPAGQTEVSGNCYDQGACPAGYSLTTSGGGAGTTCTRNAVCTAPKVDFGGACYDVVGCPASGSGGTTWSPTGAPTYMCNPAAACPGKVGPFTKTSGSVGPFNASRCWTNVGCPTPASDWTAGSGATANICTQTPCPTGQIAISTNTSVVSGCYPGTGINASCTGLAAGATYTYENGGATPSAPTSPTAYTCTPNNTVNDCLSPKIKYDKGAGAACYTSAGCQSADATPGTRGAGSTTGPGSSWHMCTLPLCNTNSGFIASGTNATGSSNGVGCYTSNNCSSSNSYVQLGETYTATGATNQCTPNSGVGNCRSGKTKFDKTTHTSTGPAATCWTNAGCPSPATRSPTAEFCTYPICDPGYTYAPSPTGVTAGCYPTNNSGCAASGSPSDPTNILTTGYTFSGTLSAMSGTNAGVSQCTGACTCTPPAPGVGNCPTGKVRFNKGLGAGIQCYTDTGCSNPEDTRLSGASAYQCQRPQCYSGYTAVTSNAYVGNACYLNSAINVGCTGTIADPGTGFVFTGRVPYTYAGAGNGAQSYKCTPTVQGDGCFEGRVASTKNGTATNQCWVENACPVGTLGNTSATWTRRTAPLNYQCALDANQCLTGLTPVTSVTSPLNGVARAAACYNVNASCTPGTGGLQAIAGNGGTWAHTGASGSPNYVCTPTPNPVCRTGYTRTGVSTCTPPANITCPANTTGTPFEVVPGSGTWVCTASPCITSPAASAEYQCVTGTGVASAAGTSCCRRTCPASLQTTYEFTFALSASQSNPAAVCNPGSASCTSGRVVQDVRTGLGAQCFTPGGACPSGFTGGGAAAGYQCNPTTCGTGRTLLSRYSSAVPQSPVNNLKTWLRGEVNGGSPNYYADALNNNNGAVVGQVSVVPGRIGAGFQFANTSSGSLPNYAAPTSSANTGIRLLASASLDPASVTNPTRSMTLAMWIRPYTTPGADHYLFSKVTTSSGTSGYTLRRTSAGTIRGEVAGTQCTMTGVAPIGQWSHVTMVFDAKAAGAGPSVLRLFLRDEAGVLRTNGTMSCNYGTAAAPTAVPANSASAFVGADRNQRNHFHGIIDEVAYFNSAITDSATLSGLAYNAGTGIYGEAKCYQTGCPAATVDWQFNATGAAGTPPYVCNAAPATNCGGVANRVVANPDGNGNRCWTDNACPTDFTKAGYTCTRNPCNGTETAIQGNPSVTDGCYTFLDCNTLSATYAPWTADNANYTCRPGNNGCASARVRATVAGFGDACYAYQWGSGPTYCNPLDPAVGGAPGDGYVCTRIGCPTAPDLYARAGTCRRVNAAPTQPPGVTWALAGGCSVTDPSACVYNPSSACGSLIRATVGSVDQCWQNVGCTSGHTASGAPGYTCTPPQCGSGQVAFGSPAQCYADLGCPANASGITWTRDVATQVCSPSPTCTTGKLLLADGQCWQDDGCPANYVFNAGIGTVGACQGCPTGQVAQGGSCFNESCPASNAGVTWTATGAPDFLCNPSATCYSPKVAYNSSCWDESCPGGETLDPAQHRCIPPSCTNGKQAITYGGTTSCYTVSACPSADWTTTGAPDWTCTTHSCLNYDNVTPCADPTYTCLGNDGPTPATGASCVRSPTCAQDCPVTADRACTQNSPAALTCVTTSNGGCSATNVVVGDGAASAESVFRFTVPAGLPQNRYYYHFALLRKDAAGNTTDANAFLYLKPVPGNPNFPAADGANSGNQNGRVIDCNRDYLGQIGVNLTAEDKRYVRSEIDSWLAPGDYFLVVDNKNTSNTSAYSYVLQVGGFDDTAAGNPPVTAPSYNQMVRELIDAQARIIGVESSGVSCGQAADTDTFGSQYETRDWLEKLGFDTGSVDNSDPLNPKPFVVSIRKDATDCDPNVGGTNGLRRQVVSALTTMSQTLEQDVVMRPQLSNQIVDPLFQPPVGVTQFVQSVEAVTTADTVANCGAPDIIADPVGGVSYTKFKLCKPGVQLNFKVTFQMPASIPVGIQDKFFRFDMVVLSGRGEIARFPVVLILRGTAQAADYVREYDLTNVCPVATRLTLANFLWGSENAPAYDAAFPTRASSNVLFYGAIGETSAAAATAPEALLATAKSAPLPNTDVGSVNLGPKLGTAYAKFLRIRARMNPGPNGEKPLINAWQLTFSCPPSE